MYIAIVCLFVRKQWTCGNGNVITVPVIFFGIEKLRQRDVHKYWRIEAV